MFNFSNIDLPTTGYKKRNFSEFEDLLIELYDEINENEKVIDNTDVDED